MKLKYTFEIVDMEDEIILVPVGKGANEVHGVLKLNRGALEILNLIKSDTTQEDVVTALSNKYDNDRTILISYVDNVLAKLCSAGLLEE